MIFPYKITKTPPCIDSGLGVYFGSTQRPTPFKISNLAAVSLAIHSTHLLFWMVVGQVYLI